MTHKMKLSEPYYSLVKTNKKQLKFVYMMRSESN